MNFCDLCEEINPSDCHPFDLMAYCQSDIPYYCNQHIKDFYKNGYVILENVIPHHLIDAYVDLRERFGIQPGGWKSCTPYMVHPEIRDLCCCNELNSKLNDLFGGNEVGLNLNLTGFVSTLRDFHQDYYLNVSGIGSYYVATWMALDDIHPDSGPFEFAVGSHLLPPMTQKKIFEHISPQEQADPNWPKTTEWFVAQACEDIIREKGFDVKQFLGKKGDVLVWHSRLLHRGSKPIVPGMERRSLISHYSVVSRRSKIDMPNYARHKDQGLYFIL